MNHKKAVIRPIADAEELPCALLLDADPSWEIIEKYINRNWLFVYSSGGGIIGVYVLLPLDELTIELKNIAVRTAHQNKGIGTLMLRDAIARGKSHGFGKMIIGTGNASIGPLYLYQREGFVLTDVRWNFVTDNYPEPVYDDGIRVRHMLILSLDL